MITSNRTYTNADKCISTNQDSINFEPLAFDLCADLDVGDTVQWFVNVTTPVNAFRGVNIWGIGSNNPGIVEGWTKQDPIQTFVSGFFVE